ncbi:MAG TPA: YbbR-like domain-containing protein [Candidatus Cloacimonadota bacterium]|nr:YbbR-like domain-containing protein [Candidatus Cloacimonadota bacterium]
MVRENLGLRILAVILAVLIWLQSVLATEHRTQVNLRVNLTSLPQNLTLDNVPKSIPFTIKGRGWDILGFMLSKPNVSIDASKITPDSDIIALDDYKIDIPESQNITLLGPAQSNNIAVQADVFHRRVVPIRLDFADDNVKRRLSELRYLTNPSEISIFGPKSKIQNISSIFTIPVTMEMLTESRFDLALVLPVDDVSLSDTKVTVTISSAQQAVRVFSEVILPPWCLPSRVAVKVQGAGSILDRFQASQIEIKVAAEPDAEGFYAVEAVLPEGIELLALTPDKVKRRP